MIPQEPPPAPCADQGGKASVPPAQQFLWRIGTDAARRAPRSKPFTPLPTHLSHQRSAGGASDRPSATLRPAVRPSSSTRTTPWPWLQHRALARRSTASQHRPGCWWSYAAEGARKTHRQAGRQFSFLSLSQPRWCRSGRQRRASLDGAARRQASFHQVTRPPEAPVKRRVVQQVSCHAVDYHFKSAGRPNNQAPRPGWITRHRREGFAAGKPAVCAAVFAWNQQRRLWSDATPAGGDLRRRPPSTSQRLVTAGNSRRWPADLGAARRSCQAERRSRRVGGGPSDQQPSAAARCDRGKRPASTSWTADVTPVKPGGVLRTPLKCFLIRLARSQHHQLRRCRGRPRRWRVTQRCGTGPARRGLLVKDW